MLINAYCTTAPVPLLDFEHVLNNSRDLSDPGLGEHLNGFFGYAMNMGDGEMSRTRYHVLRHIQRVRQHVSLSLDEDQFEAFSEWAGRANAIVYLPDGSVRDPWGRVLLSPDGDADPEAEVPFPEQAWQRKVRTEAVLASKGVDVPDSLPPVVSEPELRLRDAEEVAGRALALFVVALRAESLTTDPISVDELQERFPAAFSYVTPQEFSFLAEDDPSQSGIVQFCWRYESLFLLQWALGMFDSLPFPADTCDVPLVVRALKDRDLDELIQTAALRSESEILDALDLHYRLHWAIQQARMDGQDAPAGADGGVIYERHYALNWLVRFEDSEWDDVDTPT